jgi:hypothetical protein
MKTEKTCKVCGVTGGEFYKSQNNTCKVCFKRKSLERYYKTSFHRILNDPEHCLTCNMELLPYVLNGRLTVPKFFCDDICRNSNYLSMMAKNNIIGRISTGNF